MKKNSLTAILASSLIASAAFLTSCHIDPPEPDPSTPVDTVPCSTEQIDRLPWYNYNPESENASFSASTDALRLEFFGWTKKEDKVLTVNFPETTTQYRRAILSYRMGAWGSKPGEWDILTMIMIKDKSTGKYFEIARAITPYGNWFDANWSKTFYLDVTEYLPMMTGDTEFYVFYGGWDATEERAHTVTLGFNFYEGDAKNQPTYFKKIYDSRGNSNLTTYRAWSYGDRKEGEDIESGERLGVRNFTLPDEIDELLMKVAITGHGMEAGTFPDRKNYQTRNAAEFDVNFYDIVINGEIKNRGRILYDNDTTYKQAGSYQYDRAGWGPGLPVNVQYWTIKNLPDDRNMSIDFNLDRYISPLEEGAGAGYVVEVDIFGYDKEEDKK